MYVHESEVVSQDPAGRGRIFGDYKTIDVEVHVGCGVHRGGDEASPSLSLLAGCTTTLYHPQARGRFSQRVKPQPPHAREVKL